MAHASHDVPETSLKFQGTGILDWMMQYIPPPTSYRRTLEYALVIALVGVVLAASFLNALSVEWDVANLVLIVGILSSLLLKRRALKQHGFDGTGVYRRGKLLFSWRQVKRIGLKFAGGGHSVTLVAQPTWRAFLSGPMVERETWVSYGVSVVFELEDGRAILIASNLDSLTSNRVAERIDEVARSANPSIEIE